MKPSIHFSVLGLVAASSLANAQLLVTEIQSDGLDDFWELTNTGGSAVNLSGYKWNDSARSINDAVNIPSSTFIASGESIIFTKATATAFRSEWGIAASVQIISDSGGPGLGKNDAITLFDAFDTEVLYLSYAVGGFTKSDGSLSGGDHAGKSAGGASEQALIWDPAFGVSSPRYTFADGTSNGTFAASASASNIGSPGYSGFGVAPPSIILSLSSNLSTFSESVSNPAAMGTVTRNPGAATALEVTLASSDTTEATVPATVTILPNQTSASFDITAIDDSFPDGDMAVTLTASATGASAGTTDITVEDDGDVFVQKLLLTEIQSKQDADGTEDYWELTNISSETVSLAGYGWHDNGRSAASAATNALPPGTTIAPDESVIFTALSPEDFRSWWGIPASVQIFQSADAPGLGKNDGVSFFDEGQNEIFFFNYEAGGFKKADGSDSDGDHAGISAGGSQNYQSAIWVPNSGTSAPRYTAADGTNFGTFQSLTGLDLGSPGITDGAPSVRITSASVTEGDSGTKVFALDVTRNDNTTAFSVDFTVTGGTVTPAEDFLLIPGTLTFTAGGADTLPINITIVGDTVSEDDETIEITLSNLIDNLGNTIIANAIGTVTILTDDTIPAMISTPPVSTTIATGGGTTLSISVTGSPAPNVQWYQGQTGDTSIPVGSNSTTFITPNLAQTTSYWARVSNAGGSIDTATVTVSIEAAATTVDLSKYVRVGRYNLPEPSRTTLPPGTPAHNLLCQEASGVTYNWDTDTLFIACDGGRSITQVSKTGQLIDTMTLALRAGAPQGTDFYDPEGITYIGAGEFVLSEERDRQLVKFTYAAGTTLSRANTQTVKIGTFVDNTGTEGLSFDPLTGGFICLKEISPIGIFQTNVNFAAGTATNGSPTTQNSINLFDPALLGLSDVADVFALSNLPAFSGQPQEENLLVIGQEDARVVNISRSGVIHSTLQIVTDLGNPLDAGAQQHEGVTMDRLGNVYVVNENGGGSIDFPQLWVYAPSSLPNAAPTAVSVENAVVEILENTSTASPVKIGDLVVTDDGLGTNDLSLAGVDAAAFEITGNVLFLKSGISLDFETKSSYSIVINADDTTVGATPDTSVAFTLTVLDQVVETGPANALIISEVAPWSSGNSPVGADWFEVTNISAVAVDVSGWKMDDGSAAFANSVPLSGITSIAPDESVIFIESSSTNQAATVESFRTNWFGFASSANLQIGTYTGSGIGLSTGGDAVNIYNSGGTLQAAVSFGPSDQTSPYQTFDNTIGVNDGEISLLSETRHKRRVHRLYFWHRNRLPRLLRTRCPSRHRSRAMVFRK